MFDAISVPEDVEWSPSTRWLLLAEALAQRLARMTPDQRIAFADQVLKEARDRGGIELLAEWCLMAGSKRRIPNRRLPNIARKPTA